MKKLLYISLISIIVAATAISAETVERIVAVVGDQALLASELSNQVQMYLFSMQDQAQNVDPQQVARRILHEMINDELILIAARNDTTVAVTDDEVQASLNEHMASIIARFPSEDAFLQELRQEGLTKRGLEKRYIPEIKEQLLKQKIIGKKLANLMLSRQQVEDFFNANRDSLPDVPVRIKLAHILLKYKVSPQTEDSVRQIAEKAREEVAAGADFAEVAQKYAAQAPGVVGGRIGYIHREEVVPDFGRAAFSLQPGSVSGVVRSEYGFHIIKSHSRIADSVDVSQILFPLSPSAADTAEVEALADSLYNEIASGADFREIAKEYSDDDASRGTGGETDPMTEDEIREEFVGPLAAIDVGGVTEPIHSQLGLHILMLLDRESGRPLDMDKDYDVIRNMARQAKTSELVENWVNELKQKYYVDIRDPQLL